MKLIKLTRDYKCEWKSLIGEFEKNNEKLTPLSMKGNANTFEDFLIESNNSSKGINLKDGIVPSDVYFLVDDNSKYLQRGRCGAKSSGMGGDRITGGQTAGFWGNHPGHRGGAALFPGLETLAAASPARGWRE